MTPKPIITLQNGKHYGIPVVWFRFAYVVELVAAVKSLPGTCWCSEEKAWYQPHKSFDLKSVFSKLQPLAFVDYSALKKQSDSSDSSVQASNMKYPHRTSIDLPFGYLEKMEQKRYSKSTINSYTAYMKDFIAAFTGRELEIISKSEINQYILTLIKEHDISPSQQNLRINAIKFYYENILGTGKQYYELDRPRESNKLPDVLSKEEIQQILGVTDNLKHRFIIIMLYSCGLRRSELVNIRLQDIDSKRRLLKVRDAKGRKDRYVPLSSSILKVMAQYYHKEQPAEWLFEGQVGRQYSVESVWSVVKKAAKSAGIKRNVYPHIFRHSFATHHLEQGTDLRFIQEWLGHYSSKTTEIYTHVTNKNMQNFKNPIDDILDDG